MRTRPATSDVAVRSSRALRDRLRAIVVVGDDDAIAMTRVVDLVQHENAMIVHVEILPGIRRRVLRGSRPRRGHSCLTKRAS